MDAVLRAVYRSKLSPLLARINTYLVRWIRNKYRRLDGTRAAHRKTRLGWPPASPGCSGTGPGSPAPGDEDDKSPMTGDCHAGICGSRGLQCPRLPDLAWVVTYGDGSVPSSDYGLAQGVGKVRNVGSTCGDG